MVYQFIIFLIAGFGAGIVTGLISASAVMFAAPVLIVFLKVPIYNAIGISLAIDVFASLTASYVFYKNKNLDLKKSFLLVFVSILFVIIGSYFSQFFSPHNLSWAMGLGIFGMGIAVYRRKKREIDHLEKINYFYVVLAGIVIGLVAGIFGAGGGLMILFSLVFLLKYNIHRAIGTSVLIMVFIAFFGSITHYYYSPFRLDYLLVGAVGGILGAYFASDIANKLNEEKLLKVVGVILSCLGLVLFFNTVFKFI